MLVVAKDKIKELEKKKFKLTKWACLENSPYVMAIYDDCDFQIILNFETGSMETKINIKFINVLETAGKIKKIIDDLIKEGIIVKGDE